jgi:Heat induced stress protein YflT domain/Alternative complex III, ActD subunit
MNSVQNDEITTNTMQRAPVTSDTKAVIAIYNTHPEAEKAVNELQRASFDVKRLSVVGKDYHTDEQVVGYYNAGDRMKHWGKLGALWGGLWGLLFGAAFFWVPGLGPLLVAGPLAASIVAALESAVVVGGLSALGSALFSIGIPKDSVVRYETAIKADKYLLVAHGTDAEIANARQILRSTNPVELNDHVLKPASERVLS